MSFVGWGEGMAIRYYFKRCSLFIHLFLLIISVLYLGWQQYLCHWSRAYVKKCTQSAPSASSSDAPEDIAPTEILLLSDEDCSDTDSRDHEADIERDDGAQLELTDTDELVVSDDE